jgi:NADH-quinone oxidoreductase subunit K
MINEFFLNSIFQISLFVVNTIIFLAIVGSLLVRSNLIVMIIVVELIFFASSLNFICFGFLFDDIVGQLITLFILSVAAAESTIVLSVLVLSFQITKFLIVDISKWGKE